MAQLPAREVVVAAGAFGEFEGEAGDAVVFGAYRANGTWSPRLVALISQLLGDGPSTLIDVGAHIGLVAIGVAEQRPKAHCIAFEPAPGNFELLGRNVRRHRLQDRFEVHRLALDAESGSALLALCEDNSGDHHLLHAATTTSGERAIEVQTARLDDVLAQRALAHPIVMKLDCQGAEARVLRGARALLEQVDHLVVEWWPAGLVRMGDSAEALHALLATFPYAALLDQERGPTLHKSSAEFLASLAWIPTDGSDPGFFDLLLTRSPELTAETRETFAPR
jgi:FkbM family methyltransferase